MLNVVTLKEICTVITKGTTPTTVGGRFSESGINFIKSESLSYDGSIDGSKFAFVDLDTHRMLKRSQIAEHDILYSIAGVHLGKCGMATASLLPANTNQAVAIIRVDPRQASPAFIAYFLRNPVTVQSVLSGVAQSAQPNVNLGDIGRFRVPNFPLPLQIAIAEVLGSLDDKIELNRQINKTLEAMAQAIFRDWFVDFGPTRRKVDGATDAIEIMGGLVSDPDRARELAALFPAKMGDAGLPEGWIETPASALIEFNPKEPMKKGVFAPYTDMASLPTSGSIADIPIFREFGSGMRFRNGDALLARITPCLENGKTALVDFLKDEATVGWGSTEFIVMRAKSPIPMPFSYLLARDNDFRDTAIRNMSGTSGRQRVQAASLENYRVACPNDQVFVVFDQLVTPLFELISANGRQNRTLTATRDLLLPKLMSGEIRLRDAERAIEAVV